MPDCQHENFAVQACVHRITGTDDGSVVGYSADIRIRCADCDTPFEFIGVPFGLSANRPMASIDAQELHAPIAPPGAKMAGHPGFTVRLGAELEEVGDGA